MESRYYYDIRERKICLCSCVLLMKDGSHVDVFGGLRYKLYMGEGISCVSVEGRGRGFRKYLTLFKHEG